MAAAAPAKEAVFDDEDDLFGAKPAPAAEASKEKAPKAVPVVAAEESMKPVGMFDEDDENDLFGAKPAVPSCVCACRCV